MPPAPPSLRPIARKAGRFGGRPIGRSAAHARWLLLSSLTLAAPVARPDASDPRQTLAERLAVEGRCAAALDVLSELRAEASPDAGTLVLAGTCEIQLQRYDAAVATLREAAELAPERPEVHLRLGIALYHAGDLAGARSELARAEAIGGVEQAELLLYQGLLLLEEDRPAEAAETLERARSRDAAAVEPVASFYGAVATARSRDREQARALLERVEREWPGTSWADQAALLRERLDQEPRRRWARVRAGFEYDSNVVLQSGNAPLPSEISSRGDQRGVWSLEAGTEWLRTERWVGGVLAAYGGSAYDEITSFDSHYPTAAVWVDRRLDPATTLRLLVDGGFAWVDYDPYYGTQRATVSLLRAWHEAGLTEVYGQVRRDDYWEDSNDVPDGIGIPGSLCPDPADAFCGPPGLDEARERDRDGWAAVAGIRHTLEIPAARSQLRFGYEFEHFDSQGTEYRYDAHSVSAGALVSLPFEVALDVSGVYTYRPYDDPTTFPDPPEPFQDTEYGLSDDDHREHFYAAGVTLARPLAFGVTASASYRYERNHSNAEVFDYDRQVFGVHLTWSFGY
jgi:tetratricopeptide (TPR) repeat protein